MADAIFTNTEENIFWLQIFNDKAEIMLRKSSPVAVKEVERLKKFIINFDALNKRARQNLTNDLITQLNYDSIQELNSFRQFVAEILRKQLKENFYTGLLPLFISHIITMIDFYKYLLEQFRQNKQPQFSTFNLEIFWLPIFSLQTTMIGDSLGIYSSEFRKKAYDFEKTFSYDLIKAIEYNNITLQGIKDFMQKKAFDDEVYKDMSSFAEFLVDMIELVRSNKMPSTLSLEHLDHIYRCLCYFVTQLSVLIQKPRPACNPTAPRLGSI